MGGTYDRVLPIIVALFGKCFWASPNSESGFSPWKGEVSAQNTHYHYLNWIPLVSFVVNIRGTNWGGDLTYSSLHLLASEQDRAVVDQHGVRQGTIVAHNWYY